MSKSLFKQPLFYTTVLSLSLLGLIIASYVFGWTTPTQNPPAGNVVLQSVTPGGSTGYIQFNNSGTFGGDANLFWDNANKRFGIGTTTPAYGLHIIGTMGTTATTTLAISSGNVGIGTTAPGEKLEVAGNIKLSGSSPTYKITNVVSPTASSDVATKGYVDAASASLNVYKNDGTTLLGPLVGPWTSSPGLCSGWGFWSSSGGLYLFNNYDCQVYTRTRLYYIGTTSSASCTGTAYTPISTSGLLVTDGVVWGFISTNTSANYQYWSYRDPGGPCTYLGYAAFQYYAVTLTPTPICGGTGPCIVK